ncbi:hypothetical protein JZ751_027370 [Albula glossodonta]|uniref:Uncharacterized protein n=1 Tax=Albula glossodonta TaxID=121402 RepID=A0A8T2MPT6_9TELE|nr:hypothetical protein JZ751_027370 [Albula glossodonta]
MKRGSFEEEKAIHVGIQLRTVQWHYNHVITLLSTFASANLGKAKEKNSGVGQRADSWAGKNCKIEHSMMMSAAAATAAGAVGPCLSEYSAQITSGDCGEKTLMHFSVLSAAPKTRAPWILGYTYTYSLVPLLWSLLSETALVDAYV